MKTHRPPRPRARGIASLEFVLVLPVLVLILFGIVDVSLLLSDKAVITNAAGEAVRQGVMLRATPVTAASITSVANAYMANALVTGGTPTSATVTVTPSGACKSAGTGNPITVAITYNYQGVLISSALHALTGPITATAVNYCE